MTPCCPECGSYNVRTIWENCRLGTSRAWWKPICKLCGATGPSNILRAEAAKWATPKLYEPVIGMNANEPMQTPFPHYINPDEQDDDE